MIFWGPPKISCDQILVRAKPVRAKLVRAKPVRAKPVRAKPVRAGASRAIRRSSKGRRQSASPRNSGMQTCRPSGQVLLEFALVLPLLIVLFVVMVDFGDLMLHHAAVRTALRECGRLVLSAHGTSVDPGPTLSPRTLETIKKATAAVTSLARLDPSEISITSNPVDRSTAPDIADAAGSLREIEIRVQTRHHYIVPYIFDKTAGTALSTRLRFLVPIDRLSSQEADPIRESAVTPGPTPEPGGNSPGTSAAADPAARSPSTGVEAVGDHPTRGEEP